MKYTKKARGLTIIGVMVGVAFGGSAIPTGVHVFEQRRASERLRAISSNLAAIDIAVAQWHKEHVGFQAAQANLDGADGKISYLKWPVGPVSGSYAIADQPKANAEPPTPWEVHAYATFDGGNKGPMNRARWQEACGADPTSCGL